jgi:hypothetical protein
VRPVRGVHLLLALPYWMADARGTSLGFARSMLPTCSSPARRGSSRRWAYRCVSGPACGQAAYRTSAASCRPEPAATQRCGAGHGLDGGRSGFARTSSQDNLAQSQAGSEQLLSIDARSSRLRFARLPARTPPACLERISAPSSVVGYAPRKGAASPTSVLADRSCATAMLRCGRLQTKMKGVAFGCCAA